MAPVFYDIEIDASREVTQQDVDRMTACVQAYGKLRAAVAQIQTELMMEMERIKARGKPVVDIYAPQTTGEPTEKDC